jgi:hypothetical protein
VHRPTEQNSSQPLCSLKEGCVVPSVPLSVTPMGDQIPIGPHPQPEAAPDSTSLNRDFSSPMSMDHATQDQGQELHQMLSLFKQATSTPLSGFVLETPKHKSVAVAGQTPTDGLPDARPWRSPRLKKKNSSGKGIIKLAQDLIAKKCDILKEDEALDKMTLQHYLYMYKHPLDEQAMDAITKLSEVSVAKEKIKIKK